MARKYKTVTRYRLQEVRRRVPDRFAGLDEYKAGGRRGWVGGAVITVLLGFILLFFSGLLGGPDPLHSHDPFWSRPLWSP